MSELRGGITKGGGSYFGQDESNGIPTFADTNGFAIDLDVDNVLGAGLTNWHVRNTPTWRSGYSYNIDESLTWQKGKHSITDGRLACSSAARGKTASRWCRRSTWGSTRRRIPAAGLFTTTAFQGASAAQLTDASALYAMLTGRVRAITGQAALDAETNKYVAFGARAGAQATWTSTRRSSRIRGA